MRAVSTTIVLVVLIVTVGCSAVTNPSIPYPGAFEKQTCAFKDWETVKGSLDCASVARRDMAVRADDQAAIPRVIGAVLIPLSAAIAGLAMTGTTGTPVTALTLAGVTLMGEGFWLSSPARRQAYRVGESAVQCVITTMQPFAFLEPRFSAFEANVRSLRAQILEVDRQIADVTTMVAAVNAKFMEYSAAATGAAAAAGASETAKARSAAVPEVARMIASEGAAAQEDIAVARYAVTAAKHVHSRAQSLTTRMNGAPGEIHSGVDRIIRLVNEEIDKTEPTMEMVRQAIAQQNQLRTSAFEGLDALIKSSEARALAAATRRKALEAQLAQLTTSEAIVESDDPVQRLWQELDATRQALAQARTALLDALVDSQIGLNTLTPVVSKELDTVGDPSPAENCVTLARGGVGAKPLKIDFQRADQTAPDPITPGETTFFIVSGGSGDVQISADADARGALELQQNQVSGVKSVAVKAKAEAKANTYLIDVADSVSNKVVKVAVKAPPPTPLTVKGTDPTTPPAAGTTIVYTATGGTGTCSATLTPQTGFGTPKTTVVNELTCVVSLAWVGPAPTAAREYKLEITFGQSPGSRTFTIKP